MLIDVRMRAASKAALFHFMGSALVAAMAAVLVFLIWYPPPYGELSGGRNLFLIVVSVDVICGPLLTLVLFNPGKPRLEIFTDMSLVILIQFAALGYGMHTAFQARPLFLVHELDRFRVISLPDYNGEDVTGALSELKPPLRARWFEGPVTVGIREPKSNDERTNVIFESVLGGRDYSQRPEFYVPYDAAYQPKALARAKPLNVFLEKNPERVAAATDLLKQGHVPLEQAKFLPVVHRQDWIAVIDAQARIIGFLPGDGFAVP